MSPIRRLYLYAVAAITLVILLGAVLIVTGDLIILLLGPERGSGADRSLAELLAAWARGGSGLWLGIGAAALLCWGVHWFLADRPARALTMAGGVERRSAARKAYLYIGQGAALAALLSQTAPVLNALLRLLTGQRSATLGQWPERQAALAVGAAIAVAFWVGLRRIAIKDGDFGLESGPAVSIRRAYYALVILVGGMLAAVGAAELLRAVLRLGGQLLAFDKPAGVSWRTELVVPLIALLLGAPMALIGRRRADLLALSSATPAHELNAFSRVTLVYGAILAGTSATLVSLALLLRQGFLIVLGQAGLAPQALWEDRLVAPLAYLPVGAAIWVAAARVGRDDSANGGESPETATVRRLCRYLVLAASLGALWFGLSELLQILAPGEDAGLLSLLRSLAGDRWADTMGERFSLAAALVLAAAPAWWGHWWSQQVRARRAGPEGQVERASWLRHLYLYGVVILAAGVVLSALAVTAYRIVTGLAAESAALVSAGVSVALAIVWGLAHFVVLWGDRRLDRAARQRLAPGADLLLAGEVPEMVPTGPAPLRFDRGALPQAADVLAASPAPAAIPAPDSVAVTLDSARATPSLLKALAVIDGADGKIGVSLLLALRKKLPGIELWPMGLNAGAQAAMLGALTPAGAAFPVRPADALSGAAAILGPSDLLAPGALGGEVTAELAASIAASPARKLLLPPRDPQLRWVAAPNWPLERWIENAVIEAADLLGK